jgi:hypothetical protein
MEARSLRTGAIAGLAVLLMACGKEKPDSSLPAQAAAPASDSAHAAHVATGDSAAGTPGMDMAGMSGAQMGAQMTARMQSMQAMHGDSLMTTMMPKHHRMLGEMMAKMESELGAAKVPADARWRALVDSIEADTARMSPSEMEGAMAAHHARVARMIEMHRTMMGGR